MAAKLPPFPGTTGRRDWKTAFDAIKKLLANGDDTTQVFRIMRALNVGNAPMNYAKFIATEEGGRMAYERKELAQVCAKIAADEAAHWSLLTSALGEALPKPAFMFG